MGRMMDFYNMESSFSIVDISLKLPQMAQKAFCFKQDFCRQVEVNL